MKKLSNTEESYNSLLEILSQNLEKISHALMLKSLMDYRKNVEEKISQIISNEPKKAVWELCDGKKKVTEIAELLGYRSHSAVSQHIKPMLEEKIIFNKQIGTENYPISIDSLIDSIILSNI